MTRILRKMTDYVYPARCPVCHDVISYKGRLCCPECENVFELIREPYCMKCGKPLGEEKELCSECSKIVHSFDRGRAVFVYEKHIKISIYLFKYGGRAEYGRYYSVKMGEYLRDWILQIKPDAIIPIPLHKKRYRQRGYNQAALIAKGLGKATGIAVYDNYLVRKNKTRVQKKLSHSERQNNLKNAFIIGSNDVKLDTVILVDDIFTTGATMDQAAFVLKENGVKKVYYAVLSIGSTTH